MIYNKLQHFVSQPRLTRFLNACGQSKTKAQKLYIINLRISQEAYPVLNLFETFLRNSINRQVGVYFSDSDWIINQKAIFMSDFSLNASRFKMRSSVENAEKLINQKGGTITSGKIIAEQTLGFWTSLFETHHYRLIGGSPIHCFPHKPPAANRTILSRKLNEIRLFRNRIYHNEPICFLNDRIDFTQVLKVIHSIYDLLNWMDPDLAEYVRQFDKMGNKIKSGDSLKT